MTRQRWFLVGALVLVLLVLGVTVIVRVGMKRRSRGITPREWLDPGQPPEGVANQLSTLTAGESLAANGCPHMGAYSPARTARMHTMRTWPGHLVDHPGSLIHGLGGTVRVEVG